MLWINGIWCLMFQSLSLTPARPRSGHAASGGSSTGIADDSDVESVRSYGSACSTASACDHATFAFNGTTWSGRSRKYVVHCSNHNGDNEQYLTPTQRAARQVRKFQVNFKHFTVSSCSSTESLITNRVNNYHPYQMLTDISLLYTC